MASLISKASLLMVPSVYEDGTLYNVLPTGNKAPDETGSNNGYDQTRADFTFSRGSNLAATRVNADGLIEKGRENLMLYSSDLTNALWYKYDMGVTGGQTSYNGSNTAFKLTPNTTNSYHRIIQSQSWSYDVRTASFYAKADGYNIIRIVTFTGATDISLAVDLSDGSIVQESGATKIAANVESVGNEWYRISLTASGSTTTSIFSFQIYIYDDPALPSAWSGDGTSGVLFADPQRELGLVATDYIETGASTAQAGILEDMPRINYDANGENGALLLEPSRTNLITFSEHLGASYYGKTRCTIEDNSTTSPEGVINASKMTSTDASESYIQGNVTTTGTKMSWSFFAKKGDLDYCHGLVWSSPNGCRQWFNLRTGAVGGTTTFGTGYSVDSASIEDYGNGWYRCTMIVNSSAGTQGCRVNISSADTTIGSAVNSYGYFYGLQAEDASYPTSYIPTYGASVTRSLDSCVATSVSDLIGQTQGTMFVDVTINNISGQTNDPIPISLKGSGSTNSYIALYDDGRVQAVHYGFGSVQANINLGFYGLTNGRHKFAFVYSDNDFKLFIDGALAGVDTTGLVDAQNAVHLGYYNTAFNGAIKNHQSAIYPTALTDSECIALTTL